MIGKISDYSVGELISLSNSLEKEYEVKKEELVRLLNQQELVHRDMDVLYDRYQEVITELGRREEYVANKE